VPGQHRNQSRSAPTLPAAHAGEPGCRRPRGGIRYTASTYTGCSPGCGPWPPASTGKGGCRVHHRATERDTRYIALCSRPAVGLTSGSDSARGMPLPDFSNASCRERAGARHAQQRPDKRLQQRFCGPRSTGDPAGSDPQSANNVRASGRHSGPDRGFTISGHCGDGCGMILPLVGISGSDLSRLTAFVEDDRPREDVMGQWDLHATSPAVADVRLAHVGRMRGRCPKCRREDRW
jgi:hypothetical protein